MGVGCEAHAAGVDGQSAIGDFGVIGGEAGWDIAVDGDVDGFAIDVIWEDDGASFSGEAADDAFAFERAQVAHGSGLAGEAEVLLDVSRGRHQAIAFLISSQKNQQFLLTCGE